MSPFSETLSFHLNVLNNADSFLATFSSLLVTLAISCFSFSSDVCIVPFVARISSNLALEFPKSTALSRFARLSVQGKIYGIPLLNNKLQSLFPMKSLPMLENVAIPTCPAWLASV